MLRAYGAEVRGLPDGGGPDDPRSYYSVARQRVAATPGRLEPRPVLQPEQPAGALPRHRAGAVGADRRPDHRVRRRRRHRRHDQRHRALPQRGQRRPGHGRRRRSARVRCTPAAPGVPTWWKASARTSGPATYDPTMPGPGRGGQRPRVLRHDAPAGPRGGAAGRRLVRAGDRGRAAGGGASCRRTGWSSCCCRIPAAATCRRSSTTTG